MLVTTIRPRLAASASTASIRDESPVPIVSTTTSHIRPQVTSRIRSNAADTKIDACVALRPGADDHLTSTGSIAKMCRAPASRAPCTAAEPRPPTPTTATASPGLTPPAYTDEPHPVAAPQPVRQAASGRKEGSTGMTDASLTTVCLA